MKTAGKILDATVILGSLAVGYGGVKTIIGGAKIKSTGAIILGSLSLLICVYAMREAINKINE